MRWTILIVFSVILVGCSTMPDGEFYCIRSELSEFESRAESFDFDRDGSFDSEAVWYLSNTDTLSDFLAYYWLPWVCESEVQDNALAGYAYMFAVDLKIDDEFNYDFMFVDSDDDGDLDSLILISGKLPRDRLYIQSSNRARPFNL